MKNLQRIYFGFADCCLAADGVQQRWNDGSCSGQL